MRPTPAETITGVRRILKDVVEPEVGCEYARARLREVRAVLAQIDWDDPGLRMLRRYETLAELATEVGYWIAAEPARVDEFADLTARMPREPTVRPNSFAELAEAHRRVACVLADAITRISDWCRTRPAGTSGARLRDQLILRLAS
jgi:hypothetical protein